MIFKRRHAMAHEHHYVVLHELDLEPAAGDMGIEKAETRRCEGCGREKVYVMLNGSWLPLFKTRVDRTEL